MTALIALVLLVVPILELYVLIRVGQTIGVGSTILVLILVSVAGAWLVKRQGLATYRRARAELAAGRMPGSELVDGVIILFAGALLLTPGFLTDLVGLALLPAPSRRFLRGAAALRLTRRLRRRP